MRASVILLPLALLSGCLAAPDVGVPAAQTELVLPWALTECRYVVGWSNADPAIVQANLPDGFTVRAGPPLGLPLPDATAQAIIGTEAFECASGSGLNGTLEGMTYASIWIPVSPPEALADPDISEIYYKFNVLVPDAPRREAMLARGLPVGAGEIAWDTAAVPNGLAASLTIEGAGDFRFELVAPRPAQAREGSPFMEITPAGEKGANGFAIWKANYAWDTADYMQGTGYIDWPEGHWVTQAIGSARAPATFHAGTWSFNGTLTLPR